MTILIHAKEKKGNESCPMLITISRTKCVCVACRNVYIQKFITRQCKASNTFFCCFSAYIAFMNVVPTKRKSNESLTETK